MLQVNLLPCLLASKKQFIQKNSLNVSHESDSAVYSRQDK
jgi:hypothetical protein